MMGTRMPCLLSCSTMCGTAAAASSLFTVTRTSSDPGQCRHLLHGRGNVRRVGIGHGLHHNRCTGAYAYTSDNGGHGLSALDICHMGSSILSRGQRSPGLGVLKPTRYQGG